jgi:S-DNA-T family DNA segregation ATPase FtsK/SpoIIIE
VTTQPFVRPEEPVAAPSTGGGKIALDPPIAYPVPPPRSVWSIVFPVAIVLGVLGLIVAMFASGMRSAATGVGMFGFMALFGLVGMMFRGRGAAQKMSWSELTGARRRWMARQDDIREEVDAQRERQWSHRRHFHWEPAELVDVPGSERMWERTPGSEAFAVVRMGVGQVALAMTLEKPQIPEAAHLEPATGHALRKFLLEQEYIDDVPKAVWLQRFPGISLVGDLDSVESLTRSMMCQLAAFHSPADVQIFVVSEHPERWEWAKWLPHLQHPSSRDGCGERRLVFTTAPELEAFLDEDPEGTRAPWTPPAMSAGLHGGDGGPVTPLRVIIDDAAGTPEDWAGLTGSGGYAGTVFIRLAAELPARPGESLGGARYWVGFDPSTTYRLGEDGALRKTLPREVLAAAAAATRAGSDELEEAFYATADQMSELSAERFAKALARFRPAGSTAATVAGAAGALGADDRNLLDVLGIRDPRHLDCDRLWAPRMHQGPQWMRFPVGVDTSGQLVEFDLKEGSQNGMGMHSLFVGTTGAGKSEGIITQIASACTLHSSEVLNVVFSDFKLKSAAGTLQKFPNVVAAVSNLADERHLVGRMYEALDGELDRRGAVIAALDDCPDVTTYNERRRTDPSLPPIPVLWVVVDEYNEMLRDKIYGPKFRALFERICRVGRSLHVFLQLVGQTVDTQNLREVNKLLGFRVAARLGREEDSREAIGSGIAAHIPEQGAEGTAYLRVALRQPREFRYFFTSARFTPRALESGPAQPVRAGTWFTPRVFTAGEAVDLDGLLASPPTPELPAAPPPDPDEDRPKIVDALSASLRARPERPPRPFWLPPLPDRDKQGRWHGHIPSVVELVDAWRGRPWDEDYGANPGLSLPVALVDRPRDHTQEVHCLDLQSDNALIVCAPQRGATTTLMTMVCAGALMYRPERVQFYCIAASGPQLAQLSALPHVAGVVGVSDSEGVSRLLATVEAIAEERDRIFATRGLDMQTVREAKFGPNPVDVGVSGGDVVLVVDGLSNFIADHPDGLDRVVRLMNARNYGVRVVLTTSSLLSLKTAIRNATNQVLEMKLVQTHESLVRHDPADPARKPAAEVPDCPGRGVTQWGHPLMVAFPAVSTVDGAEPVSDVRAIAAAVTEMSGVSKATTVLRLPESIPLAEVLAATPADWPAHRVPFGISESTLEPIGIDFDADPHFVATGQGGAGRTAFLRTLMYAVMNRYQPDEATIVLFDQTRKLIGVVPEEPWLSAYAYRAEDIRATCDQLAAVLATRQPPPGTSQADLLTKRFWTGREFFVVCDDISSWNQTGHPMAPLLPYIEQGADLGLHIVCTADIRTWSFAASMGSSVLGRIMGGLPPVVALDGRRLHGPIMNGVYADPQRPGKGKLVTRRGVEGVLVAWTDPPLDRRG